MQNISGFGSQISIMTSVTFPAGFVVTQFADDADMFDLPQIQLADKAMGGNGDLLVWGKANPLLITLNVIAGTDDDRNLAILAEANRVGRGKKSLGDQVTLTVLYPDGRTITLSKGALTDAPLGTSVASAGRMKSKAYSFAFENMVVNNVATA